MDRELVLDRFFLVFELLLTPYLKPALKIKRIGFSPKLSIQPCRPVSDSALPGAIGAQFRPKLLNQKATLAHA